MIVERGLAEIFADVEFNETTRCEPSGVGPGNLPGCIVGYQRPDGQVPRRLGYYPNEQLWHESGDGQFWIGVDVAEPPTAADLKRKQTYDGYAIELEGGEFTVPVIRAPDGSTCLPCSMKIGADGKLLEPLKPAYESYGERCSRPDACSAARIGLPNGMNRRTTQQL